MLNIKGEGISQWLDGSLYVSDPLKDNKYGIYKPRMTFDFDSSHVAYGIPVEFSDATGRVVMNYSPVGTCSCGTTKISKKITTFGKKKDDTEENILEQLKQFSEELNAQNSCNCIFPGTFTINFDTKTLPGGVEPYGLSMEAVILVDIADDKIRIHWRYTSNFASGVTESFGSTDESVIVLNRDEKDMSLKLVALNPTYNASNRGPMYLMAQIDQYEYVAAGHPLIDDADTADFYVKCISTHSDPDWTYNIGKFATVVEQPVQTAHYHSIEQSGELLYNIDEKENNDAAVGNQTE
jgi:hypothetical protein